MSAPWSQILAEIPMGCLMMALNLFKIIVPLMILIELLMTYKLVEKLAKRLSEPARFIGISGGAVLPLLVGVIMGVTYGAGVIMELNKRAPLNKKDLALIGVFFYVCHGIIETTVIFAAAGANIFFVSVGRFLLAVLITAIAARLPWIARANGRPDADKTPGE